MGTNGASRPLSGVLALLIHGLGTSFMFTFMTQGERRVPPGLQRAAAEGETRRLMVLNHHLPSCFRAPCGLHFPASLVSTRRGERSRALHAGECLWSSVVRARPKSHSRQDSVLHSCWREAAGGNLRALLLEPAGFQSMADGWPCRGLCCQLRGALMLPATSWYHLPVGAGSTRALGVSDREKRGWE